MENFERVNNNEQSGIFSKLKRSVSMMLMAGALTACDDKTDIVKDSSTNHPDRFDKASATIDANLKEGKMVVEHARQMGVEIPEGVSFSYLKEQGKVVSITVGGKEIPFEMSLDDEVKPEIKTSSDAKVFLETTPEAKPSNSSSGEVKTNSEIKNF